jgi:Xaa-Pro aminopeptidase
MDKLAYLRTFMDKEGLAALLIPNTDEFQGEYIAPHARRLTWLTEFTGSAGFAIITQDKATFFTDGRYMLQAKKQLPTGYELYNTAQKTPREWVSENLPSSAKLGYDPWLFTESQLGAYDRPLVAVTPNPIDSVWTDRPPRSHAPLKLHPITYTGEEDTSKRKRIAAGLAADHLLLTSCDSIAWLLNIRGDDVPYTPVVHSACLLQRTGTYDLFLDLSKVSDEVRKILETNGGTLFELSHILTHLKALKGSVQLDPQTVPSIMVRTLEDTGVSVVRERDPCLLPKALKNEVELEGAKEAHIQDGIAICRFLAWLEEQPLDTETTELSAAAKLLEFRKQGSLFQGPSFNTISASGPNGAIIHYAATENADLPLRKGELYLLDSGGQYLTGTTDVTRTIFLGQGTYEQKERYTQVLRGLIALTGASFPAGTTGAQLDVLARQFLWQTGCDYDHGTGHGVGSYLGVHEGPQGISKRAFTALQPGMILSNEPGYYKAGEYGIRIENLMAVIPSRSWEGFYGFETLTLVPLAPDLIDPRVMTYEERDWVEHYHARICFTLSPLLDPKTKAWLEKLCDKIYEKTKR